MSTICKTCGGSVEWRPNGEGWQCFDAGTSTIHWDKCSQRKWDQVKSTGKAFSNKDGTGYAGSIHGTKWSMKKDIKPVKGKLYAPSCDCQPPWEHCAHTAMAGIGATL